ncbi:MAG: hypothetical protein WCK47_14365 [bacterium]|nr:hypothetical protein [Candidatus Sumerlaeota bacterium]
MPSNQLHPVYHSLSYMPGSRIDLDLMLPVDLDAADLEDFIDQLSEPPKYHERISPVSTVIGTEVVRGKNWTEMMIKSYRVFLRIFSTVSFSLRQALADKFGERGMVPFTSVSIDPDTLHRIVELDYEHGENTYGSYMELFRSGVIAPCATAPFHVILPLLANDFDRRLVIRMGWLLYWKILRDYHNNVVAAQGEEQFVVPFWLPECGYSKRTLEILHEEFLRMTKAEKIRSPHLLILLDNGQAVTQDTDVLMKSWNQVKINGDPVSVVFRDKNFSDWVTYSNPSVKKLIDRTIAKVDSALNSEGVDYCWAHVEDVESLTFSPKSASNFEQKVVKLAQLSYLTMSPDFYVRRKINGKFGRARHEPQEARLRENTALNDWHTTISLGRWEGVLDSNAPFKLADENRPFIRRTKTGKVQEIGPQCWKIAFSRARSICAQELKGDPETLKGGFLEILADICGVKDQAVLKRNIGAFLTHFTFIHWREHFIQHDMSEADIQLANLVDDYLMKDCRKRLREQNYVMAGVAAQGYYFVLDSYRSQATYWENLDQRAMYENVVMLTLAFRNLIYMRHWEGRAADAKKLVELVKIELFGFKNGYERYRLADYGVTEKEWFDSLRSSVEESDFNIVERAARRTAARHLRPLGYRKDFSAEDEEITTNAGHIWSAEIENSNYKWENKLFCGLREE